MGGNKHGNNGATDGADEYRSRADDDLERRLKEFYAELYSVAQQEQSDKTDGTNPAAQYEYRAVRAALEAAKHGNGEAVRGVHGGHRLRLRDSARNDVALDGFSDVELVETLLSYLVPQKDTNVTAHALLDRYGSVLGVLRAPEKELARFSAVTAPAARVLPMLALACLWNGDRELKIDGPHFAAEFFGAMTEGLREGTYAAYLDGKLRLITFERCGEADVLPSREIICSADRRNAKYVLVVRRERDIYPDAFGLTARVTKLASALAAMNKRLLDVMLFTEYGYYTLGIPPKDGGWYAQYVFVPFSYYSSATDRYDDGRDMAAELAAFASRAEQKDEV